MWGIGQADLIKSQLRLGRIVHRPWMCIGHGWWAGIEKFYSGPLLQLLVFTTAAQKKSFSIPAHHPCPIHITV
jgi:hypothetical protein